MINQSENYFIEPKNEYFEQILIGSIICFCSFIFSVNIGSFIHELGHGFFLWLHGGYNVNITFHPFILPRTTVTPSPESSIIYVGGWIFDIGFGFLLLILTWSKRRPKYFPFLFWGPLSLILEGISIILGTSSNGSDSERFSALFNIPPFLMQCIGVILAFIGICALSLLFNLLYITPKDKLIKKIVIMGSGPMLYIILVNVYVNLFYPVEFEVTRAFAILLVMPILLVLMIIFFDRISKFIHVNNNENSKLFWNETILPIFLATVFFLFGFLFFNP